MKKKCNKCGVTKDVSQFETSKVAKCGFKASCIHCVGLDTANPISDLVKSSTINKLDGTYVPDKNTYYREDSNKQLYKSRGFPC